MTAKLTCTEYDQSALQRRDAVKEIGRFYIRQEKTPKMFSISGASAPSAPSCVRTPLMYSTQGTRSTTDASPRHDTTN